MLLGFTLLLFIFHENSMENVMLSILKRFSFEKEFYSVESIIKNDVKFKNVSWIISYWEKILFFLLHKGHAYIQKMDLTWKTLGSSINDCICIEKNINVKSYRDSIFELGKNRNQKESRHESCSQAVRTTLNPKNSKRKYQNSQRFIRKYIKNSMIKIKK